MIKKTCLTAPTSWIRAYPSHQRKQDLQSTNGLLKKTVITSLGSVRFNLTERAKVVAEEVPLPAFLKRKQMTGPSFLRSAKPTTLAFDPSRRLSNISAASGSAPASAFPGKRFVRENRIKMLDDDAMIEIQKQEQGKPGYCSFII